MARPARRTGSPGRSSPSPAAAPSAPPCGPAPCRSRPGSSPARASRTRPAVRRPWRSSVATSLHGAVRVLRRALRYDGRTGQTEVVVLLGRAQLHLVRRLLHAREQRRQQVLLLVDEGLTAGVGQLVLVGHGERPGRAGLDAQTAEDAAQVVDLVDASVPLARREPAALGVVRALDVDRVRRTRPRAQLTADALLQPVRPAVQLVPAVEPWCGRLLLERVLLGEHLPEHGPEGDPEPGYRVPEGLFDTSHGCLPSISARTVGWGAVGAPGSHRRRRRTPCRLQPRSGRAGASAGRTG